MTISRRLFMLSAAMAPFGCGSMGYLRGTAVPAPSPLPAVRAPQVGKSGLICNVICLMAIPWAPLSNECNRLVRKLSLLARWIPALRHPIQVMVPLAPL